MSGEVKQWFTSDLHYYHKNICKFTDRPWVQEENEEKLIELHNRQVSQGDVVWHLGDFFFLKNNESGLEKALGVLERLNGNIRCILGNHDASEFFDKLQQQTNKIVSVDRLKEIKIGSGKRRKKLVMCHYPMVTFNQSHRGAIMIHGHEHGRIHAQGKVIDVGLDGSKERLGEWRYWTEGDILNYAGKLDIFIPKGREDR